LARGGAFALAAKAVTYPLGLMLAIVLARILTPQELGGYFLAMSLILIAAALVQFGAGPVMIKFIAASLAVLDGGRARRTLRLGSAWVLATSVIAVVVLQVGVGDWLLDLLRDGEILRSSMTCISLLVVAYAAITFCCEVLRGFNELGSASLFAEQLLQRFLLLIALVFAWGMGLELDLRLVLILMLISSVAVATLGMLFIWARFRVLDKPVSDPVTAIELFRQAPPFFLMRLNFWLMDTAPIWILGMFHPPEIVALYGVANLLALIVLAPWTVVNTSLGPAVVKLHTENRPQLLRTLLGTVAGIATLAASSVVLVLVVFGEEILTVVFSEELAPAYATTVILGVGRGLSVLFGAPALLLSMTHHQMTVFRVLFISSGLGFVAYFAAAKLGGIEWVAVAGALLAIAQAAILAFFSRRLLGMSTFPTFRVRDWGEMGRQIFQRP
jgi:O-antigen/teichoic acid export membrane protein